MREQDQIELSDAILAESLREFARFTPEGLIYEERGLLLTVGGLRHPGLSFIMRTRNDTPGPTEVVAMGRSLFSGRSRGFTARLRGARDADLGQHLARLAGVQTGHNEGLVREGSLGQQPLPQGIQVERVKTLQTAADFRDVVSLAFSSVGVDQQISRHIFSDGCRLMAPHLHAVVVTDRGLPAAGALGLLAHGGAGIYWVGTVPGARGRGLAGHAVRAVHNWAIDHGARAVTLQCAPVHTRFYERIGYRPLLRYPWYMLVNEGDAQARSTSRSSPLPGDS